MMLALVTREVGAISRCRAFRTATLFYVVVLTTFAFGWGDERHHDVWGVEAIVLTTLLPWIAARCTAAERGDDLVMFGVLLGVQPSRILAARATALAVTLGIVVISGLPIGILANRVSAGAPLDVVPHAGGLLTIALAATATVLVCRHLWAGRVWSWLAATAATAALTQLPMAAVASALVLVVHVLRADATLRYLSAEV